MEGLLDADVGELVILVLIREEHFLIEVPRSILPLCQYPPLVCAEDILPRTLLGAARPCSVGAGVVIHGSVFCWLQQFGGSHPSGRGTLAAATWKWTWGAPNCFDHVIGGAKSAAWFNGRPPQAGPLDALEILGIGQHCFGSQPLFKVGNVGLPMWKNVLYHLPNGPRLKAVLELVHGVTHGIKLGTFGALAAQSRTNPGVVWGTAWFNGGGARVMRAVVICVKDAHTCPWSVCLQPPSPQVLLYSDSDELVWTVWSSEEEEPALLGRLKHFWHKVPSSSERVKFVMP